jgi:hypothetical protein
MKYSKIKLSALFLIIFFLSGLVSCTKKSEDTADNMVKESDLVSIDKNDVAETDEDLLSVDYKEFYDELSHHGEWIEVKGNDIGVDLKEGTSSGESKRSISFSELFGIKDAHADDVSLGAFFVWKPAPNLAVGITAGEPQVYTPYSNGQWVHTSNGWYFRAASEPEEITHHYGRWVHTPAMGWLWVPGRVWAPAWVDWREQDDYIAWTPIPPSVYIVNNVIVASPVYEERFIIVERRYFIEPDVYRYTFIENKHNVRVTEWRRMDGIMVVNSTVINRGPDVTVIQSVTGRTFEPVVINHMSGKNKIKYSDREYDVYSPEFRKVKTDKKVKGPVSKPKEFSDYHTASQKESGKENKNQGDDQSANNEKKKNNKDMNDVKVPPENPGINRKYIDDKDMKNGKNNDGNKNRQEDKGDRKSGNDKGKKNNDNSGDVKQKDQKNKDNKGNENKSGKDKGNKKYRNDSYKDNGDKNGNSNDKQNKQKNSNGNSKGKK